MNRIVSNILSAIPIKNEAALKFAAAPVHKHVAQINKQKPEQKKFTISKQPTVSINETSAEDSISSNISGLFVPDCLRKVYHLPILGMNTFSFPDAEKKLFSSIELTQIYNRQCKIIPSTQNDQEEYKYLLLKTCIERWNMLHDVVTLQQLQDLIQNKEAQIEKMYTQLTNIVKQDFQQFVNSIAYGNNQKLYFQRDEKCETKFSNCKPNIKLTNNLKMIDKEIANLKHQIAKNEEFKESENLNSQLQEKINQKQSLLTQVHDNCPSCVDELLQKLEQKLKTRINYFLTNSINLLKMFLNDSYFDIPKLDQQVICKKSNYIEECKKIVNSSQSVSKSFKNKWFNKNKNEEINENELATRCMYNIDKTPKKTQNNNVNLTDLPQIENYINSNQVIKEIKNSCQLSNDEVTKLVSDVTTLEETNVTKSLIDLYQLSKDFCRFVHNTRNFNNVIKEKYLFDDCHSLYIALNDQPQQQLILIQNFLKVFTFNELLKYFNNMDKLLERIVNAKLKLSSKPYKNTNEITFVLEICESLLIEMTKHPLYSDFIEGKQKEQKKQELNQSQPEESDSIDTVVKFIDTVEESDSLNNNVQFIYNDESDSLNTNVKFLDTVGDSQPYIQYNENNNHNMNEIESNEYDDNDVLQIVPS